MSYRRPLSPVDVVSDGYTPYRQIVFEHGLSDARLAPFLARADQAATALTAAVAAGNMPCLAAARREDDLAALTERANEMRERFRDIVVLGTGGSSLGAQAICALADGQPDTPVQHFLDNLEPTRLERLLDATDADATGLLIVSKSGATAEVLAQALVALPALAAQPGGDIGGHVTAFSQPGDNPLRRLAGRWGFEVLDHDANIDGRFSVLSNVGVLPALLAGLDAAALRRGASDVLAALGSSTAEAPAAPVLGGAIAVALAQTHGIGASVLMPYDSSLSRFADWYRQLWAESLGKGGRGTTPIRALGPVDQHSQLQLYLDGPADKAFTLILTDSAGAGPRIDLGPARADDDEELAYLNGRALGDVVAAMGRATADSLIANGRPTRIMEVGVLDEAALGALFMHFMIETIVAARLFGVDPFGQPAVEDGKRRASEVLQGD